MARPAQAGPTVASIDMIGFAELLVLIVLLGIPGLWALVDILRHEFTGNNKVVWSLVVLAMPLLGALLYLLIGRGQRVKG